MGRFKGAETSMKEKQSPGASPASKYSPKRVVLMVFGAITGLAVIGVLVLVFALAMAYPNLPAWTPSPTTGPRCRCGSSRPITS